MAAAPRTTGVPIIKSATSSPFRTAPGTVAAEITVTDVSDGVITDYTLTNPGSYTVAPPNPVMVTGGSSAGATFDLVATSSDGGNDAAITAMSVSRPQHRQRQQRFDSGQRHLYTTTAPPTCKPAR